VLFAGAVAPIGSTPIDSVTTLVAANMFTRGKARRERKNFAVVGRYVPREPD
jgi:hypothetical protein